MRFVSAFDLYALINGVVCFAGLSGYRERLILSPRSIRASGRALSCALIGEDDCPEQCVLTIERIFDAGRINDPVPDGKVPVRSQFVDFGHRRQWPEARRRSPAWRTAGRRVHGRLVVASSQSVRKATDSWIYAFALSFRFPHPGVARKTCASIRFVWVRCSVVFGPMVRGFTQGGASALIASAASKLSSESGRFGSSAISSGSV
jgi:hypothetical protein